MKSQSSRARDTHFQRSLRTFVVVSAIVVLSVIVFELALRYTDYRYLLNRVQYPDGYFVEDAELGADHARNQLDAFFSMRGPGFDVFTNSLGCFDRDSEIEQGYILAIGDSATWGFVPADKNWTQVLQSLSGKQVLNCGVSGVGTRFELLKARRVINEIGFPPSLIILLYVNNDLNDDHVFPSYTVVSGQRIDRVKSIDLHTGEITRRSPSDLLREYRQYELNQKTVKQVLRDHSLTAWLLYQLFSQQEDRAAEVPDSIDDNRYGVLFWNLPIDQHAWLTKTLAYHLQSFRAFQDFADSLDTSLVVFHEVPEAAETSSHRATFFEALEHELDFVFSLTFDSVDSSGLSKLRYEFDDHLNEFGNRQAAEEMFRKLQAAGIL